MVIDVSRLEFADCADCDVFVQVFCDDLRRRGLAVYSSVPIVGCYPLLIDLPYPPCPGVIYVVDGDA